MKARFVAMKLFGAAGILLLAAAGSAFAGSGSSTDSSPLRTGQWRAGGGIGFLADTPDDTAFAANLNADYFQDESWSLGPLVQLAFTNSLAQYGFSGQVKYWLPAWDAAGRTRVYARASATIPPGWSRWEWGWSTPWITASDCTGRSC